MFLLCVLSQQMFCSQERSLRLAHGETVDSIYNFQTNVSIFVEQCNFLPQLQDLAQFIYETTERADEEGYHWELAYLSYEECESAIKEPLDLVKPLFVLYDHVDRSKIIELMAPAIAVCVLDSFIKKIEN